VTSVEHNPPELTDQVPFSLALERLIPGPDRPDYWLGRLDSPLRWIDDNQERKVSHLIVCTPWQETQIEPCVRNLPIGIAYVTDPTQLTDTAVDLGKCKYIANGVANETGGKPAPSGALPVVAGRIARAFKLGLATPQQEDPLDRRAAPRRRVQLAAKVAVGASTADCTITDISEGGAGVHAPSVLRLPEEVYLLILSEGLVIRARRVWARFPRCGLEFLSAQEVESSKRRQTAPLRQAWAKWRSRAADQE
jgi:hypothetical protein